MQFSQGTQNMDFSQMSDVGDLFANAQSTMQSGYQDVLGDLQNAYQGAISGAGKAWNQAKNQVQGQGQDLTQGINTAYTDAGNYLPYMMQSQLKPQLQSGLNSLGSRGMLDSSIAGDVLSQASKGVMSDIMAQQAALSGQKAGALSQAEQNIFSALSGMDKSKASTLSNLEGSLAQQTGSLGSQYQGLLGQLASQEAQTGATLQGGEYEILASLLPYLTENAIPQPTLPEGTTQQNVFDQLQASFDDPVGLVDYANDMGLGSQGLSKIWNQNKGITQPSYDPSTVQGYLESGIPASLNAPPGVTSKDVFDWLQGNLGNPSLVANKADQYGVDANDLAYMWNQYGDTQYTPSQIQAYLS